MGLSVDVYRSAALNGYDCTNGGVSSKAARLTLVNVDGPSEPSADAPAAMLMRGAMPGIARIIPLVEVGREPWFQMGGNYAASSDDRFRNAVEEVTGGRFYGAVAIHDRVE